MVGEYHLYLVLLSSDFFFQAEDGIRDYKVTGVQTCALPIYARRHNCLISRQRRTVAGGQWEDLTAVAEDVPAAQAVAVVEPVLDLCQKVVAVVCIRSGERIVVARRRVQVRLREELQEACAQGIFLESRPCVGSSCRCKTGCVRHTDERRR